MSDQNDIPVLTDLIEKGAEFTLSDLGLDEDLQTDDDVYAFDESVDADTLEPEPEEIDLFRDNPALEYAIHSILEEHMAHAWQEIKQLIHRELNKP